MSQYPVKIEIRGGFGGLQTWTEAGGNNLNGTPYVSQEFHESQLSAERAEVERLRKVAIALDDACVTWNFVLNLDNPKESINELIKWETTIALDPAVSEQARILRDTYKTKEGDK